MANPETGLIGILILLDLLMLGTPIGVALGLVGIGGLVITLGLEQGGRLAGDGAAWTTGSALVIDGGYSAP